MAGGRTGVGVGLGVTVALLGTATLALFVLTFIFLGQKQTAQRTLDQYKADNNDLVREAERNRDEVQLLTKEAKDERKSLVGYVRDSMSRLAEKVSGASGDTPKVLLTKVEGALGSGGGNLIGALGDRDTRIAALTKQIADAEATAARAREDMQTAVDRVKAIEDGHTKTVAALTAQIKTYSDGIDQDAKTMQTKVTEMQGIITKIKQDAADQKTELNARITRLNEQLLVSQEKIKQLQRERAKEAFKPGDEAALVDGQIISLEGGDSIVTINRGLRQHVVLGMTFEVYPNAEAIRPDANGEYPRGKASLEVVRVDDSSSTARVTRTLRGNPVSKGDVIANALYDPSKKYIFMVYGNFDGGDGRDSPEGQAAIKAMVEDWGGKVTDSLTGEVDFLVLGSRPVLPPQPRSDAPIAVVEEYIRQSTIVKQYDALLSQAAATSIPILNQNRLRTLTGKVGY